MQHIQWKYDIDPTGEGFFCPALTQKRRDYFALKQLRPAEAEAVYQCRPGAKVGSIFVEADFRYYEPPDGLALGRNNPAIRKWIESVNGIVAQGWDTAMSADSQADHSACVTVLFVPCDKWHREADALLGECDQHFDAYILEVLRAKFDIGDLVAAIRQQAMKWAPEKIVIEKKASGASAIQALANTGLPIEGVVPQENKRDRAINGGAGAGSVQGWFKAGRVLFPEPAPDWLDPLTRELKDFTGEKGGIDDQVDAMVHVVSWGIREGSVGVRFPSGWDSVEDVDRHMLTKDTQAGALFGMFGLDQQGAIDHDIITDPFADRCGRCINFKLKQKPSCALHRRHVSAVHAACESFDNGAQEMAFTRF